VARRRPATVHGLVLVDKPAGVTSHDVVADLRRTLGERRIGHAGTLDPGATGVLIVGIGQMTRLMRFLGGLDKDYECEIVLGTETDTLDADGVVTAVSSTPPPPVAEIRRIVAGRFVGEIEQTPPMVSAVRVGGERLHEIARRGETVERPVRRVRVARFDVDAAEEPAVLRARVTCSSGTFVRTLGADLGAAAGTGAHIRGLRRTRVGPYGIDECTSPVEPRLLSAWEAVRGMTRVDVDADAAVDVSHGRPLSAWDGTGPWAIAGPGGALLAVYEPWRDGLAKPAVVLGAM